MMSQHDALVGNAHGRRQDVELRLEPDPTMNAPGLAGITIETAVGHVISLDRGPGGLTARGETARATTPPGRCSAPRAARAASWARASARHCSATRPTRRR